MALYEYEGKAPRLGRGAFVAPNATVIGDVTLGEDACILFATVLRGDMMPIVIGARSNIQDGSVVHVTGGKFATRVGDDVTVGHMVLLHGCTVGDRVLVGMGSIVLDGAVIEDDAIVGAGSLVTPGTRIPTGMLAFGRPAKAVRPLTQEDRESILYAGRVYVAAAAAFQSPAFRRIDG
jgi:carbonic anhydrase/acetyltransferase-like protein (isoleucine patch superfamily)